METRRLKAWGDDTGFKISGLAKDGFEALRILKSEAFDLVMTDIRMPKIDGINLLQEIKKDNLCSCVVLLSEYSEFEYARSGLVLGAFDYLVKPLNESVLIDLLTRVDAFLKQSKRMENSRYPYQSGYKFGYYPSVEEKMIVAYLKEESTKAVELFDKTLDNSYKMLDCDLDRTKCLASCLYHNVVAGVSERMKWIERFIDTELIDELNYENLVSLKRQYVEKISGLLSMLRKFKPEIRDGTITSVCDYVLENTESRLSLKNIAEKFYMNYTYLSNTFKQKTGIHFNDYLTSVKIARAKYLIKNSSLKYYEICARLGYRDTEYFSKLFKKHTGLSPTEYKKTIESQ